MSNVGKTACFHECAYFLWTKMVPPLWWTSKRWQIVNSTTSKFDVNTNFCVFIPYETFFTIYLSKFNFKVPMRNLILMKDQLGPLAGYSYWISTQSKTYRRCSRELYTNSFTNDLRVVNNKYSLEAFRDCHVSMKSIYEHLCTLWITSLGFPTLRTLYMTLNSMKQPPVVKKKSIKDMYMYLYM